MSSEFLKTFRAKFSLCTALAVAFGMTPALATPRYTGPEGAPGIPHRWAPALKQAVGTAYEKGSANSPVWFTVAQGVLTEVFYPHVDRAQTGDLQFLVTDGRSFFSEQRKDTISSVRYKDEGMVVEIEGQDREGRYQFLQQIFTDPASPVVRIRTTFKWNNPGFRVFVLFKPAINNLGSLNNGSTSEEGLVATGMGFKGEDDVFAALVSSAPWSATSAGYVGFSDGWQDIAKHFRITSPWKEAGPGNIALTGEVLVTPGSEFSFEMALGFGSDRATALTYARTALLDPFERGMAQYESGWRSYLGSLQRAAGRIENRRFIFESTSARLSAQLIKIHEDKIRRGAIVASLSSPGIPEDERAREGHGGYHLVWPRDLYHAAMGLLAAGDTDTPTSVLKYLTQTQKPDGSWPQNFWIDGTAHWKAIQLDEMSFPILLAWQLQKRGVHTLNATEMEMIRKAAYYITVHGPRTEQDRWEEVSGYVPSTIAAEVAALRAATALTGDPLPLRVAEDWQTKIEKWTLVSEGPLGKSYYLRASQSGNPDRLEIIELTNGMGVAYASEVVDSSFLELVRLGVREATDPRIQSTLRIFESPSLDISNGYSYRRYNRDGFGPANQGGFWPHLAGERGHLAVAAKDLERARAQLHAMEAAALPSGLIPEQTITPIIPGQKAKPEVGLGVACPLVWAHAEHILLHRSIEEGSVFDSPGAFPDHR